MAKTVNGNNVMRWALMPVVAVAAFLLTYPIVVFIQNLANSIVFFGPIVSSWWITAGANIFTGYVGVVLAAEVAPAHRRITAAVIAAVYVTFVVMVAVIGTAQGYPVPWLALVLNIAGAIGGVVKVFSDYSASQ